MRRGRLIGLHVTCSVPFGAPRIDSCCSTIRFEQDGGGPVTAYAPGYALRYRGREALVIGWPSRHPTMPRPPRAAIRHRWHTLLRALR